MTWGWWKPLRWNRRGFRLPVVEIYNLCGRPLTLFVFSAIAFWSDIPQTITNLNKQRCTIWTNLESNRNTTNAEPEEGRRDAVFPWSIGIDTAENEPPQGSKKGPIPSPPLAISGCSNRITVDCGEWFTSSSNSSISARQRSHLKTQVLVGEDFRDIEVSQIRIRCWVCPESHLIAALMYRQRLVWIEIGFLRPIWLVSMHLQEGYRCKRKTSHLPQTY